MDITNDILQGDVKIKFQNVKWHKLSFRGQNIIWGDKWGKIKINKNTKGRQNTDWCVWVRSTIDVGQLVISQMPGVVVLFSAKDTKR